LLLAVFSWKEHNSFLKWALPKEVAIFWLNWTKKKILEILDLYMNHIEIIRLATLDLRYSIFIGLSKKYRINNHQTWLSDCLNFVLVYIHNWLLPLKTCLFFTTLIFFVGKKLIQVMRSFSFTVFLELRCGFWNGSC
jgi:hypothetical protein